jgi:hypothetical protein
MASIASAKYKVQNVASDGNCFYRALYGAAKSAKCLEQATSVFQSGESESCVVYDDDKRTYFEEEDLETLFILCCRYAVSVKIDKAAKGAYDTLKENRSAMTVFLNDQPSWIKDTLENNPDISEHDFIQIAQTQAASPAVWVGQIEVDTIKEWLSKVGITLSIISAQDTDYANDADRHHSIITIPRLSTTNVSGNPILYLYNVRSVHYKYIILSRTTGGKRKKVRPTSKKVAAPPASKKVALPASKKVASPASKKVASPASKKVASPASKKLASPASKKLASPPAAKKPSRRVPPKHTKK